MNERGRVLVVNFNAPELNQLARALAAHGLLQDFVRPYVNKGRAWERALAALPVGGRLYAKTFGRRQLGDPALAALTCEAGVPFDWASAVIGRLPLLPSAWRHDATNRLHMRVRHAVAEKGRDLARQAQTVVAYEGFALPAFEAATSHGAQKLLNYPVAHHRLRRAIRDEELEREPAFAVTWPGFGDWGPGHEQRLDDEIEQCDAVLLGSDFAASSFVAAGVPAHKLRVVPYGVDLATFRPGQAPPPQQPFRAVYAGQLTQRKGLSYLLRAWRGFAQGRDPASVSLTLVGSIVGSATPLAPFEHLFQHVPHQTREALAERYRQAHVFVFPTLVEGMPLVVLEAMACGLPVIVTANGPAGIVRDGVDGFIVPQRDPQAVQEKLELLHRDPERRAAMGRNAAQRALAYSWQAYAEGVMRQIAAPRTELWAVPA